MKRSARAALVVVAALFALAFGAAFAQAPPDIPAGSLVLIVTPEERAKCEAEGGCTMLSKDLLLHLIEQARKACKRGLDT